MLALETRDADTAKAGLRELGRALKQGLESKAFRAMSDTDLALYTQSARDTYTYAGIDIERLRVGPNLDIGTAFLGDTLLVGTPAIALEGVIDAAQGSVGALSNDETFIKA